MTNEDDLFNLFILQSLFYLFVAYTNTLRGCDRVSLFYHDFSDGVEERRNVDALTKVHISLYDAF